MRKVGSNEREEIRNFFTRIDPTDDEIATIVELVRSAGGLEYARDQARSHAVQAEAALDEVPFDGEAMGALRASIAYAVERSR
jgi:geranylgeranyl pyrophosphate synthase